MQRREPLFRRVNTRTHGLVHRGGEHRWSRHVRKDDPVTLGSMRGERRHGLDYTPLFRFLLSRIGDDWTATHREAVSRLDRADPIFWLVARTEEERRPSVRVGESTYFSGLCIDAGNRLALVDPSLRVEQMTPSCACCTHTFNGIPFTRRFQAE